MRAQWPFGLVVALLIWLFSGPAPVAEVLTHSRAVVAQLEAV